MHLQIRRCTSLPHHQLAPRLAKQPKPPTFFKISILSRGNWVQSLRLKSVTQRLVGAGRFMTHDHLISTITRPMRAAMWSSAAAPRLATMHKNRHISRLKVHVSGLNSHMPDSAEYDDAGTITTWGPNCSRQGRTPVGSAYNDHITCGDVRGRASLLFWSRAGYVLPAVSRPSRSICTSKLVKWHAPMPQDTPSHAYVTPAALRPQHHQLKFQLGRYEWRPSHKRP